MTVGTIITGNGERRLDLKTIRPNAPTPPWTSTSDCEPERSTYGFELINFAPAAAATDIVTIQGIASQVVRIRSVKIQCASASANSTVVVTLIRRTAANTGGTFAAITPTPRDSRDGASGAVVRSYSVNPTALGAGARMHSDQVLLVANPVNRIQTLFDFCWQQDKAPCLVSASQWLAINLNGVFPAGATLVIDVTYSEETEE
jgi:hypothetical protein